MLLSKFWSNRLEREKVKSSWNTISKQNAIRNKVIGFDPNVKLRDVDLIWILNFEAYCIESGNSTNTIATNMACVKSTLRQALDQELIDKDPFAKYKIRKASTFERALDVEDVKKIETFVSNGPVGRRLVDAWLFSFYCAGIRIGDLATLEVDNVLNGQVEYVMRKNKKRVQMQLSLKARKIALKYIKDAHACDRKNLFGLIKETDDSDEVYVAIKRVVARGNRHFSVVAEALKLPHMTWHAARAAFATYMVREGTDIDTVRQLLKHSSVLTTQDYLASRSNDQLGNIVNDAMDF